MKRHKVDRSSARLRNERRLKYVTMDTTEMPRVMRPLCTFICQDIGQSGRNGALPRYTQPAKAES